MNEVKIKEFGELPTLLPGLALGRLKRNNDIAQNLGLDLRERTSLLGQGDDIGGASPLHDGPIETSHSRVIHEGEAQFGLRTIQGA